MRRLLSSAICLSALTTLTAHADTTYQNQSGGSVTFQGQFDPSWTHYDDGEDSQGKVADNAKSNSRVGFTVVQPFTQGEMTFRFETSLGFRQSSAISQYESADSFDWDRENLRHVDLIFKTPRYGTFYLGQGSQASDNIGDRSQSPTTVVNDVSIGDTAGGYYLRRDDGTLSEITIAEAFKNFDGARRGRIRYDTPSYMGFSLRGSYGRNILVSEDGDDYWDVALAYENELANGVKVTGGLGYWVRDRDGGSDDVKDTFASGAVTLPSGFNFAVSVGDRDNGGSYYYGQAGYVADWTNWGKTSLAVDYYSGEDMVTDGDDSTSWGVALVQNIESVNADLYAGYRNYDYDDDATSYQKGESYMIGARLKF